MFGTMCFGQFVFGEVEAAFDIPGTATIKAIVVYHATLKVSL